MEKITTIFERLKRFDMLFGDGDENEKFRAFLSTFIEIDDDGEPQAKALIWEVDDVGIIFLTDIKPGHSAKGHYSFWDKRFRGREELLKQFSRYIFNRYDFVKLVAEIPFHAHRAFNTVERIGFKRDGRLRDEVFFDGQWFDLAVFSLLREEAFDNGIRSED